MKEHRDIPDEEDPQDLRVSNLRVVGFTKGEGGRDLEADPTEQGENLKGPKWKTHGRTVAKVWNPTGQKSPASEGVQISEVEARGAAELPSGQQQERMRVRKDHGPNRSLSSPGSRRARS